MFMKKILILAGSVALAASAHASVFTNGSFETGPNPGGFTTLFNDDTSISGWTVGGNSVDYIGSYWQASNGQRSLDLGGNNNGSVSQTFDTVANQAYTLTFDLSGNPDKRPTNPAAYIVNVTAGNLNGNFSFTDLSNSLGNMKWQTFTTTFVASSNSTTLTFLDAHPQGAWGPALDNVKVEAVPEPFTMSLGLASAGLFLRRRLKAKKA